MPRAVQIRLDPKTLDEATRTLIETLEREVKRLERKIATRDKRIQKLQDGMDLTKERRATIRQLANDLKCVLEDAGWVDVDEGGYY